MSNPTARQQLEQDRIAAFKEFCVDTKSNPDANRIFNLGVTMTVLTLKGFAENPKLWPQGSADIEDAIEKYFRAAQRASTN